MDTKRLLRMLAMLAILLAAQSMLTGCAMFGKAPVPSGPSASAPAPTTQVFNHFPTVPSKTYVVFGKTYRTLSSAAGYNETGVASWYGEDFHGRPTASGVRYDMYGLSCAHKTLPLGTVVRVTNLQNGHSADLVVNDRGPFVNGRIIDLSYGAARKLGTAAQGVAKVRVVAVGSMGTDQSPAQTKKTVIASRPVQAPAPSAQVVQASAPAGQYVQAQGGYFVQVGVFSMEANARNVLADLKNRGYTGSRIEVLNRGGSLLYVVKAGIFHGPNQARQAQLHLDRVYPSCFVTS